MKIYNKLIRDKIPQIIEFSGSKYEIRVLESKEYQVELNKKLQEEVKEYKASNDDINELADIVEVIYAIVQNKGLSIEEFEQIRVKKYVERGGFEKKLYLLHTD